MQWKFLSSMQNHRYAATAHTIMVIIEKKMGADGSFIEQPPEL
jgi:hypothetical protein